MNQQEVTRIVDSICRDKNIDKELVYADLEAAMVSAVRKAFGQSEDVEVQIDRLAGTISATMDGQPIAMADLGRIAAQTFKQVMIQRIREAERGSIFEEYSEKVGTIVTGTVSRFESGALIMNLGRAEGFLPRSEQIPGEIHHPGDRIRAMVLDVEEKPYQVRIVLTRSHPDYIRRLFELEVPEVGEKIIEIKALAREAGYRTKIAVTSIDTRVDAVGACVGVRGSRIRNIVDELGGEKIDIVRWNESSQILIANALKPAEVQEIALCFELSRATVVVAEDQLSLAIGKRGQNVRLGARLTGWDVDILTPTEYNKGLDHMEKALKSIEGVEDVLLDKMMAMGLISPADVDEIGPEPLMEELEISEELAKRICEVATVAAKRIAEEAKAAATQRAREAREAQEAKEAGEAEEEESAEAPDSGEEQGAAVTVAAESASAADEASEDTVAQPELASPGSDSEGNEPAAEAEPLTAPVEHVPGGDTDVEVDEGAPGTSA